MSWIICKAEVVTKVKSKRHLKSYKREIRTDLKLTMNSMNSERTRFRYNLFTLERTFCQSKKREIYCLGCDILKFNGRGSITINGCHRNTSYKWRSRGIFFSFFVKWWYDLICFKLTGIEVSTDGAVRIWTQVPEFSSIFQGI